MRPDLLWYTASLLALATVAHGALFDGLVAYYPLDGDYGDASGDALLLLTPMNAPPEPFVSGVGGSLSAAFASSSLMSQFPIPALPSGNAPRTMAGWLRWSGLGGLSTILHWGLADALYHTNSVILSNNNLVFGAGFSDVWSTRSMPTDQEWHHAAITHNSTVMAMYIDGELVWSGASLPLDTTPNTHLYIGNPTWGGVLLTGALDELMVFNRTLAAAEVAQLASPTRAYLSNTPTMTASATASASLTPGLACPSSLFRSLPRTDLVGAPLTDAPLAVSSEGACRIACCSAPGCDGYAFAFTELRFGEASCFLYANISSTAPSSGYASGMRAGVVLPMSPAGASPSGTTIPHDSIQRGPSITATATFSGMPTSMPTSAPPQTPAPPPVLHGGLLAYYPLDGDYRDHKGSLDLTRDNHLAFTPGVFGLAAAFNGGDSLFSAVSASLPSGNSPRTITAWVWITYGVTEGYSLFSYGLLSVGTLVRIYGTVNFMSATGFYADLSGIAPLMQRTWVHIALKYDGMTLSLYKNGSLDASGPPSNGQIIVQWNTASSSSRLYVGGGYDGDASNGMFAGMIDDVRIYDRALTLTEIQMLSTRGSASSTPSPSSTPYCQDALFRVLPRMDLVGTLVGTALTPGAPTLVSSLGDCRQACCDAATCDGYSFATGDASFINGGIAGCFLYVNITQLIPSSVVSSGIYESTL